MRLLIIGGSVAGISAGLRARELRPDIEATVVLADAYPHFSICGLPFYLSGETPDWRDLAHRTRDFKNAAHCTALALHALITGHQPFYVLRDGRLIRDREGIVGRAAIDNRDDGFQPAKIA